MKYSTTPTFNKNYPLSIRLLEIVFPIIVAVFMELPSGGGFVVPDSRKRRSANVCVCGSVYVMYVYVSLCVGEGERKGVSVCVCAFGSRWVRWFWGIRPRDIASVFAIRWPFTLAQVFMFGFAVSEISLKIWSGSYTANKLQLERIETV